ncbi:MAG: DMT family transporter [Roseomonas sp.]|nr:DMT family transporter [Roseomonas sp.]MCA3298319.1 DMT family transporter [Roseomonas sp.]
MSAHVQSDTAQGKTNTILHGTLWASLTAIVWSAWPAFTRLAVTESVTPADIVLLRYGIGGLILLPVLLRLAGSMPRHAWLEGLWFALLQGAPLAMLTTKGLALAPAGHLTLSTGLMPLFTSLLCFYFLGEAISNLRKLGLGFITLGALAIGGVSISSIHLDYWKGDILFVCAGMMGSVYLLRMRRSGLSALQGAALLSVYSMLIYLPFFIWFFWDSSKLAQIPTSDLLFQGFYQGVLMGALTIFSLGRSTMLIGAPATAMSLALLPVASFLLAFFILGEVPTIFEMLGAVAISLGAFLAALSARAAVKIS